MKEDIKKLRKILEEIEEISQEALDRCGEKTTFLRLHGRWTEAYKILDKLEKYQKCKLEREAIKRILDRIDRWKMGVAGEHMRELAIKMEYYLIDNEFRKLGGGGELNGYHYTLERRNRG